VTPALLARLRGAQGDPILGELEIEEVDAHAGPWNSRVIGGTARGVNTITHAQGRADLAFVFAQQNNSTRPRTSAGES